MVYNRNRVKIIVKVLGILFFLIVYCFMMKEEKSVDLELYDTEYTYCKKNLDGTYSMYVYNTPIQYCIDEKYELIKNEIEESQDIYAYKCTNGLVDMFFAETIDKQFMIKKNKKKIEFSFEAESSNWEKAQLIDWENIYGEIVQAVVYTSKIDERKIAMYSSNLGIQIEYANFNNNILPLITINGDFSTVVDEKNGYSVLKNGSAKECIVYAGVLKKNSELYINNRIKIIDKKKDEYEISLSTESAEKIHFSIEIYAKSIPDSAVYSNYEENSYLSNIAVIGRDEVRGIGLLNTRFRVCYYLSTYSENVISAFYNLKCIYCEKEGYLQIRKCREQWRSSEVSWKKQPLFENSIMSKAELKEKSWVTFEITDFIKECIEDPTCYTEGYGCTITSQENVRAVIATSDNSEYIPYLEIVFKELPSFYDSSKINLYQ